MGQSPGLGGGPASSTPVSYSPKLRRAFNFAALVVALLPLPVGLLQLLPAYRIHTRFLVFYAPLVCLLTLAYLFYVRDALARLMFAHLLDPLPRNDYYRERISLRIRRLWVRARSALLALLPAVLLLSSFALVIRYTARLDESVAVASLTLDRRLTTPEDVALLPAPPGKPAEPRRLPDKRGRRPSEVRPESLTADTVSSRAEALALWQRALETARISEIPYFAELTVLYIGSFMSALVALVMMGLREYAKEALGLSERDVVLGRLLVEPDLD
jgi:hypothetical protein